MNSEKILETQEVETVEQQGSDDQGESDERPMCNVCGQRLTYRSVRLQLHEATVCPFCLAFKRQAPFAAMVPEIESDFELLGAWAAFASDAVQWHLNISWKHRHAKLEMEDLLPDAITQWAQETPTDDGHLAAAEEKIWPFVIYGHLLSLNEVVVTLADKWHLVPDMAGIHAAIKRPEVARVWQVWLIANADYGKSINEFTDTTVWERGKARVMASSTMSSARPEQSTLSRFSFERVPSWYPLFYLRFKLPLASYL